MVKVHKISFLFKIALLLAALALSAGLMLGSTYCRYITQKDLDVEYKAKATPSVYMGDTAVNFNSLFSPAEWQTALNQTSADFSLQNTKGDGSAPQQDIKFSVRVCVVQETAGQDDNEAETLPVRVVLNAGDDSFEAEAYALSQDTPINRNSNMDGEYFIFNGTDTEEAVFCLDGNNKSEIDFSLTVDNLQSEYQTVYLCIKRI